MGRRAGAPRPLAEVNAVDENVSLTPLSAWRTTEIFFSGWIWRATSRLHDWSAAAAAPLAVGLAYFAAAELGEWLVFPSAPVSALWLANAVLLSGLILSPRRRGWAYLLAVIPFHFLAQAPHAPLAQVTIQYFANGLEALIGAWAIRHLAIQPLRFDRLQSALVLIVFAAVLAPLLTSYLMAAAFHVAGLSDGFVLTTVARAVTDSFATLTLVPLIVHSAAWLRARNPPPSWKRVMELGALCASIVAVCAVIFGDPFASTNLSPAFLFAPIPCLLWASVRFGVPGASASVLLLGAISTWAVLHGYGPFSVQRPMENALSLQFFLVFSCIPLQLLAAVLEERQQAARELRKAESLHMTVLASLHDQIAVLDRYGIVVETNASWSAFAGQKDMNAFERATRGDNFLEVCSAAARNGDAIAGRVFDATEAVLTGGPARNRIEFPVMSKDGMRWFDISVEPLNRPEGGAVVTRADITSRKRAEGDASTQRQQLAHMGRAAVLGELSGAFAHELNQPLTSILGNAEAGLILLSREEGASPELGAILQDIVDDDIRAAHVIQRLRALLTKGERQRQQVDLNAIVRETLGLAHSDLIMRNVTVEVRPDVQAPAVLGDRVQIHQLILNLVMNACEAMADQPSDRRKLTVATKWLQASGCVELSVADQGHGINAEQAAHIFEPFVTSKKQGLGLGLAICRSIADAHGAQLAAENAASGGAIFRFIVPIEGGAK